MSDLKVGFNWPWDSKPCCKDKDICHYRALWERNKAEADHYKALLFHHWQAHWKQTKGMQRMARKIKRLTAKIAAYEALAGEQK